MAGHSKWANIKHRKAAQDAKKGKIFTRLIREITIAARMGGAEIHSNPRLRAATQTALANNMTKDTIERAIKRGLGDDDAAALEEIRYEGYGPGGVAVMVDCVSDNRNRTVSEVRHAFTKQGGSLGTDGSVAYLFKKQGILNFPGHLSEEALMEAALEAGAEDIIREDEHWLVTTTPEEFSAVHEALEAKGMKALAAEITMTPATHVTLSGEAAEKCLKMIDALEELEDVQNVYTNLEIDDETMARLQN